MQVVIRVDASTQIGSGHVMRCATLAHKLRSYRVEVVFICRELTGHLCDIIEAQGFRVIRLSTVGSIFIENKEGPPHAHWLETDYMLDALETAEHLKIMLPDWLIVDHYALDNRWEEQMRSFVKNIMVVDDIADRVHECDILLDQNLYERMDDRYQGLIPKQCKTFFGPRYSILREEFFAYKKRTKERDGRIKRMLVFFGGSDPDNVTMRAMKAILSLNLLNIHVDIVVGYSNPHKENINEFCSNHPNFNFHCQVSNMAELMFQADLAIGAGGSATWERCCLGLPTITIVMAKNQLEIAQIVAKQGAIWNLGYHLDVDNVKIANAITHAMQNPSEIRKMSLKASDLMNDHETNEKNSLVTAIVEGIYKVNQT